MKRKKHTTIAERESIALPMPEATPVFSITSLSFVAYPNLWSIALMVLRWLALILLLTAWP